MSVLDFLRTKKGSPQTQIGEMEKKLAELRAEIENANAIVAQHAPKRAHMLLSDATEESIIASDKDADLARLRLERLELAEIALLEQIDAARDSDQRTRRATELERAANAIEEKTKAVDAAIAALATAFADLAAAVPDDLGLEKDFDFRIGSASPLDAVRSVIASGLYSANPDMFETTPQRTRTQRPACVEKALRLQHFDGEKLSPFIPGLAGEESKTLTTSVAARRILIGPLRDKANALRGSSVTAEAAE